jgi:hypothetical protein
MDIARAGGQNVTNSIQEAYPKITFLSCSNGIQRWFVIADAIRRYLHYPVEK